MLQWWMCARMCDAQIVCTDSHHASTCYNTPHSVCTILPGWAHLLVRVRIPHTVCVQICATRTCAHSPHSGCSTCTSSYLLACTTCCRMVPEDTTCVIARTRVHRILRTDSRVHRFLPRELLRVHPLSGLRIPRTKGYHVPEGHHELCSQVCGWCDVGDLSVARCSATSHLAGGSTVWWSAPVGSTYQ